MDICHVLVRFYIFTNYRDGSILVEIELSLEQPVAVHLLKDIVVLALQSDVFIYAVDWDTVVVRSLGRERAIPMN